ncbi:MAG: hypothetical protein HRT87_05375 [Legionellales bacterium]|nr:hypothetical protein [Legionellales bacterium]
MFSTVLKLIKYATSSIKITLILFLGISTIHASNLGMIKIISEYNEPFMAYIPISSKTDVNKLQVKLADEKVFANKGIIREDFMDEMQVEVVNIKGENNIALSSKYPVFTNFFTILLDLNEDGLQEIYSVLVDLDNPVPIASLMFGTELGDEFADIKDIQKQIDFPDIDIDKIPDEKLKIENIEEKIQEHKNEIREKIQEHKDEILDKIDTPDLAPEDKMLFKSKLYHNIINKTPEVIQDIYQPDGSKPTTVRFKEGKMSKTSQERRDKLKTINEAIGNKQKLSRKNDNGNNTFQISMGNSKLGDLFRKYGYENTQTNYINALYIITLGLLLLVIATIFHTINNRKKLKKLYIGNFNNNQNIGDGRGYSRKVHKQLKKLLQNGELDSAINLFKDEFINQGMSLYGLSQYYTTFQNYGIQELNNVLFSIDKDENFHIEKKSSENINVVEKESKNDVDSSMAQNSNYETNEIANRDISQDLQVDLTGVADDIVTAKLNLASAYMNMRDFSKAKNILLEVRQVGNLQQCKEADRILKKLKF